MRLGLSATAAAAALYGAVILFGVGPATPSALDAVDDLRTPVVHLPHGLAVSGSELRLPQVSPGPGRHRSRKAPPAATGDATAVPAAVPAGQPEHPAAVPGQPEHPVPAPGQPAPAPAQPTASPASPPPAPTPSVPSLLEAPLRVLEVTAPPITLPQTPELPPLPTAPSLALP